MDGLYFLLTLCGVVLVVLWAFRNDRVPPDRPTSGFLAMRDETPGRQPRGRGRRGPDNGDLPAGG